MTILKHEILKQKKYTLLWLIMTGLIISVMFSEFSEYYKNPEMVQLLTQFPQNVLKAFSLNQANLTNLSGFLSILSVYIHLLGGTYAVMLGNNCLSREERERTAEIFLSLPISRERILIIKWLASCLHCLIFSLFTFFAILVASTPYEITPNYIDYLFLVTFSLFMIQMLFLSLGMFIAAFFKRVSRSNAYSVAFIVASYFISLLMEVSESLKQFWYITPFKYFDTNKMLKFLSLDSCGIGLTLSITLVLFATSFYLYPKRDLPL